VDKQNFNIWLSNFTLQSCNCGFTEFHLLTFDKRYYARLAKVIFGMIFIYMMHIMQFSAYTQVMLHVKSVHTF